MTDKEIEDLIDLFVHDVETGYYVGLSFDIDMLEIFRSAIDVICVIPSMRIKTHAGSLAYRYVLLFNAIDKFKVANELFEKYGLCNPIVKKELFEIIIRKHG